MISPSKYDTFTIKVVDTIEEFDALQLYWEQLLDQAQCYIYQSFEWNRIWWDHFGEGQQLHILTFWNGEQLVAILPTFLDRISIGKYSFYSRLRFIGSSVSQPRGEELLGLISYSDYLDLIVHPDFEQRVCNEIHRYIKAHRKQLDEILLEEVPPHSPLLNDCLELMHDDYLTVTQKVSSVNPIIRLEPTWDDYLQNLSKRSRYHARRYVKFAKDASCQVFELEQPSTEHEMLALFDQLVELHQQRWNHLGFAGSFAEKRMYHFTKDIIKAFYKRGWVAIKKVRPVERKDENVAIDLLFTYKQRYYLVHRGMNDESIYTKWSPGNVLLNISLEEATNNQALVFDFLRGKESFKFRSANEVVTNKTIQFDGLRFAARLKGKLISAFVDIKRHLNVEWEQFNIIMNQQDSMYEAYKAYVSFLWGRMLKRNRQDEESDELVTRISVN